MKNNFWLKFFVLFFTYGFIRRHFGIQPTWIEAVVSGLFIGLFLRLIQREKE